MDFTPASKNLGAGVQGAGLAGKIEDMQKTPATHSAVMR